MGFTGAICRLNKLAEALNVNEQEAKRIFDKSVVGGYAKVWSVDPKEKYSIVALSTSERSREPDENGKYKYTTDFTDKYTRFIGNAHRAIKDLEIPEHGGLTIKILSCEAKQHYDKEKEKVYNNWIVYDFEIPENRYQQGSSYTQSNTHKPNVKIASVIQEDDDDELPF